MPTFIAYAVLGAEANATLSGSSFGVSSACDALLPEPQVLCVRAVRTCLRRSADLRGRIPLKSARRNSRYSVGRRPRVSGQRRFIPALRVARVFNVVNLLLG